MRDELEGRLNSNLERVDNLVKIYEETAGAGSGRASVPNTDLLRSAVVFLHATLEDVVRSVLSERWPLASDADLFKRIPFAWADKTSEKLSVGQLAEHFSGQSVEDVVRGAVVTSLDRSNFNNVTEVVLAVSRAQFNDDCLEGHESELQAMMKRRHLIVHRADQNQLSGSGQHAARSLGKATVKAWRATVQKVCAGIIAQLT